tara:strand:- start:1403 stop:1825 length:423 start_codon:yes stop_codon:yes gene_type:complete
MPFYSGYTGKIKRGWTDQLFSQFIRERAKWQCQNPKCDKKFDSKDGKQKRKLHCCHLGYGRAHIPTRWNEYNCLALCIGCHQWVDQHPWRAIWLLNQHFNVEEIIWVKDQYRKKVNKKEFELIERERIKKLIKEMDNEQR